jgi:glycosyltransferase involved in cell wall biosynthesis
MSEQNAGAQEAGAPRLSVAVPCFDEEASLPELYQRITAACQSVVGESYEIVLVNDGSRDGTWDAISELCAKDTAIVGVDLSRNHGHQLAVTAGLSLCRGDRILILDADLQDPPELLPQMFALMDEGAEVVYGKRTQRVGESWFKRITAKFFYRLVSRLADVEIPEDTGDFRLLSRRALDVLREMPEQHRFIRGMVSWIGFKQVPIHYERPPRVSGTTKYPLSKMIQFAIDGITGFSIRPLRLAAYMGGIVAFAALSLIAYIMWYYFHFGVVRGWTSLLSIILFLGGAQMLFLGLIGEYLGRLFLEAKRRPLFIIKDVVRSAANPQDVLDDEQRQQTVTDLAPTSGQASRN